MHDPQLPLSNFSATRSKWHQIGKRKRFWIVLSFLLVVGMLPILDLKMSPKWTILVTDIHSQPQENIGIKLECEYLGLTDKQVEALTTDVNGTVHLPERTVRTSPLRWLLGQMPTPFVHVGGSFGPISQVELMPPDGYKDARESWCGHAGPPQSNVTTTGKRSLETTFTLTPWDLLDAIEQWDFELAKRLLHDDPAVANLRNYNGATALHLLLEKKNPNADLVIHLLAAGANINAQDDSKQTPLHIAAKRGSPELIKLLRTHGADISIRNAAKKTALEVAVQSKNTAVIELLR